MDGIAWGPYYFISMKKCVFSLGVFLAIVSSLFAYEEYSLPNLIAPTRIKPFALEVQFQHQFLGRIDGIDKFDRFFGISDGADGCFTLRSAVWSTAQIYGSYDNMQLFNQSRNEFVVGTSYATEIPRIFLHLQGDVQFFSYASFKTYPEKRFNNVFVQCALQNDPLFDRIAGIVDVGYDFDRDAYGLGLGLDVKVVDAINIYGEYFPVLKKFDDPLSSERTIRNPFLLGVKITTFRHQFFFFLGNATEIGSRHLMMGTLDNNLRFGFAIKRLFSFPYPWF
jgi:hypothetical protein